MASQLFLVNIDLNGNQALGLRAEMLGADPSGGGLYEGRVWINSTTHLLKYYDGTTVITIGTGVSAVTVDGTTLEDIGTGSNPSLRIKALGITDALISASAAIALSKLAVNPLARANHTGTQLAATISDFDTQVRTSTLNQMTAPTADLSINSHKLTSVTDPTSAQDAATKAYVDAIASGLDWKASVRAATTANGTLATAFANGQVVDGVTLVTGNRILLKNQTTGADNGIYVVAASGAPTRATDADASAEVTPGLAVFVEEGTTNGNTGWALTTDAPITIGSTALVFAQFMGPGTYSAGTGITLTGTQFTLTIPVPISSGGTNAITAAAARTNLAVPSQYTASVGDNSSTSIAVTHNLNNSHPLVQLWEAGGSKREVLCEKRITDANTVTLLFSVAPTTNQYDVVVVG